MRHGQASLFGDDYDQLSPLGEQQARELGRFWSRRSLSIDRVVTGPRRRQVRTAEIAGEAFEEAGGSWPRVELIEDLDEYRVDLQAGLPALAADHPELGEAVAAMMAATEQRDRARLFQRAVEVALTLWSDGSLEGEGIESWTEFLVRVRRAIATVTEMEGRSKTVAAFSSAGTIGVAVGQLLTAEARALLELSWAMSNCSITEILFSRGRRSLSRFNAIPHLEDRLHSYR